MGNMNKVKLLTIVTLLSVCAFLLSGCWNYRETEKLAIVSGVAIDKTENGKVLVTVEIINVGHGQKQSTLNPIYLQTTGESFFDVVRKLISFQGKKLYWSHAKVIIVSEDIAKEGISHYLDFLNRDAEVRADMWILLSREKTASDIFDATPTTENIVSIEIDNAMREQGAISRYPDVELYQLLDDLAHEKRSAILPTIGLVDINEKPVIQISGTAIIKRNKLIGYLNDDESKSLLWVTDELKGGLFVLKNMGKSSNVVTLEINKSKTELKAEIVEEKLVMNIEVTVNTNIGGILGEEDYISVPGRILLKKQAEEQIKGNIEALVIKAQKKYKADIFGFGNQIRRNMPQVWKSIEKDWDKYFTDLEVKIDVEVNIEGSGLIKKPTKVVE